MITLEGFRPVAEVTADERARVPLTKAGAHKDERYSVMVHEDGTILLTPLASIPKRELLVWENPELRASLLRGLAEHAAGLSEPIDDDWIDRNAREDED